MRASATASGFPSCRPLVGSLVLVALAAVFWLPGPVSAGAPAAPPAPAAAPAPAPAPQTATLEAVSGQVALRRSGAAVWQVAQPGTQLQPGDELMTWDRSYAIVKTSEGHQLKLGPRTQVRVDELMASSTPGQKGGSSRFRLWIGQVWATVSQLLGTESRFEVETDTAVAAVRGTEFVVGSEATGRTVIAVRDGQVVVEVDGQSVVVPPGYGLEIVPGVPPGEPQPWPYPAAPDEMPPEPGAPPEQPPAPPAQPAAGLPASLSSFTVRDVGVVSLGLNPEFHLGPVGLALDLRIYYTQKGDRVGFFLDPSEGTIIDIDSVDTALRVLPSLFRWVEFDTPAFGLRWGRLDRITVGQGLLVSDYSFGDQSGLRLRADLGGFGVLAVAPTNDTTNVSTGRLFVRPLRPLPLELGLQAALERWEVTGRTPPGPVQAFALDAIYPLGALALYAQAGTVRAQGDTPGASPRIGSSAGLVGALGPLAFRAEYRTGRGFPFGYFDGLYEQRRELQVHLLALPDPAESVAGYRLQADLRIPLLAGFSAGAFYEQYQGAQPRLGMSAGLELPHSLQAHVTYYQSPVEFEPFRLDSETATLVADVRYPVRPGLFMVLRRIQSFGAGGRSSLTVTTEFSF